MRLLEAAAVSVSFGGSAPLPGPIDLTLDAGEVLSLEGPSGAGKTTLLRALALLDARMHGEVRHRGARPGPAAIPAFRRKVVYLPQKPPALPGTTEAVLEAPFALKTAAGVPFDRARARALLARLGLPEEAFTRRLQDLSVGEAQRVLLARALLVEPEVLLLDEPTSALDPASRDAAEAAVGAWLGGGERAAILVSHDPASSARLRTRRLRFAGGRLEAP